MKITHKKIDGNIHSKELIASSHKAEYNYYNVDIWSELKVGEKTYQINYQAGQGFYNNDFNCPYEDISLSLDGGCDRFICILDQNTDDDLYDEKIVSSLNEDHEENYTPSEMVQIKLYILEVLNDEADMLFDELKESYEE